MMSVSQIIAALLLILGCAMLIAQRMFSSLTTGWADVLLIGFGCFLILIAALVVKGGGAASTDKDENIDQR